MLPPLGDLHRIECWLLHHGLHLKGILRPVLPRHGPHYECGALLASATEESKVVLPRGLAPRASAFAERRAELLHFGSYESNESKTLRHACSPVRQPPLFPSSSSVLPRRPARPPADLLYSLPPPRRFGMRDAEASLKTGHGALTAWRQEPQHRRACRYTNGAFESGGCVRYRAGLSSASARR